MAVIAEKDLRSALDRLADVAESMSISSRSLFNGGHLSPAEAPRKLFTLSSSTGSDEVEENDGEPLGDLLKNLNDVRFLHGRLFPEPLGPLLMNLDDTKYFRKRPLTPMDLLPDEIYLKIFLLLDAPSLLRCLLVNKKMTQVGSDNVLWRSLYQRDKSTWTTFYSYKPEVESVFSTSYFNSLVQNVNNRIDDFLRDGDEKGFEPETLPKVSEWKLNYRSIYQRNSPQYKTRVGNAMIKMKSQLAVKRNEVHTVDLLRRIALFGNKPITLAMYGKGRMTSAKRLLYQMMSNESPFKVNKLYAGHDGVGSGVGFKLNGIDFNVSVITKDVNVMAMNRVGFENFFRSCEALCYVVDSIEEIDKAKEELNALLENFGIAKQMPLVIFSCTFSSQDPAELQALVPCEMASLLGLDSNLSRQWCVKEVLHESVEAIYCAFDWIANSI